MSPDSPSSQQKRQQSKRQQTMAGIVVRRSGDKTVAVEVSRTKQHPLYRKSMTSTTRYLAHDPANKAVVGQRVTMQATRPLSRHKRWVIIA